ncbi:hypothetical protein Nepgr_010747 [Nepenthes gracilis]|uniref:DYW domain-containing protein n=1 Tax=Nepenthes gracilis TaxID=150966 RepID=A0AAD3XLC5_NEPGR|nr:hypothetical protein Nepgr_010747 [Nepenthes gracilis]
MFTLSLASPAKFHQLPLKASSSSRHEKPSIQSFRSPNFECIRSRLIHQVNVGHVEDAISTLDLMFQYGLTPDNVTFSIILKSSIRARNFHLGKLVHHKLIESQVELDSVLLNSLITLYSKSGDWKKASEIFETMTEKRDLVSWSAMISCFANNGFELKAIETFIDLINSGLYPNEFCFAAIIRACSNVEYSWIGEIIYGFLTKTGHFVDICVGCALIDMFAKGFGDLDSAKKMFDIMPERNVVAWSLMIARFVQMGHSENAVELFLDMELSGYKPDRFTLTSVISACAELELLSFGKQLHSKVIKSGLTSDACVGCSLVDMYAKCVTYNYSTYDSRKVFDHITDQNVMSWTAIITAYVQSGRHDMEAIELFIEMVKGPVLPNHFTFASVLKACANLSDPFFGEQVHSRAVKLGLASDSCVGNSVVAMYCQSDWMEEARKAFDVLFEKNMVSYNTIVDGYAKSFNSDVALELFHQMETIGLGTNDFTFTSLLSGAATIGAVGKGELIHTQIIKAGFESNQRVSNALISMYSRCGNIEFAHRVFSEMQEKNIISWTSMITGFSKHGFATRALEMFKEMIEAGIKPNEITYIAVLSACSHVGMISEGRKHFGSMYNEYGILPRMEHYACMVDLLGRSGLLIEALDFINSMHLAANALVWRTLLGACLLHGNTEIGKHAAEMVIEQEPHDPAAYTLLSNLYASKGKWEDMAKIRSDMKGKNLNKEAGCSWIEIENKVHKFYVGDTSHPQAEKIYEELNQIVIKIKEMGYLPNTGCVLHDMKEEQKEHYLLQHSEKIAVVFGLISTPMLKPIRVFKNLRVCGDCHSAMKYISELTGREIVVRDSNRFHHFNGGSCSCNDYW